MSSLHNFLWSVLLVILLTGIEARSLPPVDHLSAEKVTQIHTFLSDPKNKIANNPGLEMRYSWQHMSRFYPTAQVPRDTQVRLLKRAIDPKIGDTPFMLNGIKITVDQFLQTYKNLDAFMVVSHGEVILEYYNHMRPNQKHNWWSCGKVIGSTLLAILEEEGKIDVSKKVSAYLSELKGSVWDSVSVEEALDMATGLDATEHDEPGHDAQTNPKQGWYQWSTAIGMYPDVYHKNDKAFDVIKRMKRRLPGYSAFEYNSINTFVINRIVEKISGKPLNELFSERIWSKIGARNDGYVVVDPDEGYGLFYGLFSSTLEDMAHFGMIFTPSWHVVASKPIIGKAVLKRMQTSPHPEIFDKKFMGHKLHERFPGEEGIVNRYQWDAVFKDGDMYKSGFGGQGLYVSPRKDIVIVWFGSNNGDQGETIMARSIAKNLQK